MTPAVSRLVRLVGDLLRWVRWYLGELTDESAYERYLAHHAAHAHQGGHSAEAVMSRREFERWRVDRTENRPGARCC